MNAEQLEKMRKGDGFIAALDQSGGSTPKALGVYGISEDEWTGEDEMFDRVHEMRTRIITSPSFTSENIVATILFEQTMDRDIDGVPSATYLWDRKGIVPFLKTDKGLADESQGVQLMKPNPGLDDLLGRANDKAVFGTKMRSVVKTADQAGVKAISDQQFEIGKQILAAGLMPILEPEIDIHSPSKAEAEAMLRDALLAGLEDLADDQQVMFKLTLPEEDGYLQPLVDHPKVLKVVALSGGYSREEANDRLSRNPGVIASFSRAFTEGLTAQLSDEEFDRMLGESARSVHAASVT